MTINGLYSPGKIGGNGDKMVNGRAERLLFSLKEKHQQLDKQIRESYKNYENDFIVENMKKEKLKIKREIEVLQRQFDK